MQKNIVTSKNEHLYYRVEGTGEPVLLVHGFGEDGAVWDGIISALENKYRFIVPDLMGSGRSTGNTDGISMESMAEQLRLVLSNESIDRCKMIGHSMGGYITLAYAEKYSEMLVSFGLFHSTAYADSDEKKEARKKNIDFIQKNGSAKFIQQTTPNLFAEETRNNKPELISETVARYSHLSPASLADYTRAMMNRPDRISVLEKFKKPVLFIMGEYDTAVPLEQGLKQCSIPEFSYIYICTRSGHMGMLEEPEFCVKAIDTFLSAE